MSTDVTIKHAKRPQTLLSLHNNPVVNRVLNARGVKSEQELDFALADLPRPDLLPDIDLAVNRLIEARSKQHRVMIIGDYDCDGATSTALAVLALNQMGFEHVEYLVPNRFDFGYGLSPAIVDVAMDSNPDLIMTVDNGVASVEGVKHASRQGVDVVVTDHHLPPTELPKPIALVNPNLTGCTFPSKNIAGVGVCFYVMVALRAKLIEIGLIGKEVNLAAYLDLVAIGTVADVVPLDKVNRTFVQQGLLRMRSGATRPGVSALMSRAGKDETRISTTDIGFGIAPRLNAAGRLADMTRGIECLLANDDATALTLATELDEFNKSRRKIEVSMREEAEQALADNVLPDTDNAAKFSVVLFDKNWHQGVIGIVAGRLKEQFHKPTIVFAADEEDTIKGSARSIPSVHIRDVLDVVASANPGLIIKFGGHSMAAGLSIPRSRLTDFADAFDAEVSRVLAGELPDRELHSDGGLLDSERTLANAQLFKRISPWGQGFPEPQFDDVFLIEQARSVGANHNHLKLRLRSSASPSTEHDDYGEIYEAIAFNQSNDFNESDTVRVVYWLDVNRYRGDEALQLLVQHIQITER